MKHELVGNEVVATENGVTARCTCGWSSGYRFSGMVASALFRQHLEDVGKKPEGTHTIIYTRAFIPDDLSKAWLQHLRDFDVAHPGCHFEVLADGSNVPVGTMVEMMRVNPGFDFQQVFTRRDDERLYDVAKKVCHEHGMDWTDPRDGKKWPAPKGKE
jgi:hypothetical protein